MRVRSTIEKVVVIIVNNLETLITKFFWLISREKVFVIIVNNVETLIQHKILIKNTFNS